MLKLLIDSDVIVYRAGHGAAKGDYLMNVEYAENILYPMIERFMPCDYECFLTGKNNFRHSVATVKPYKGNRDPSTRPRYYKQLRDYLVEFWGAKVIDGREADDAMGESQTDETIICSIDKDLKMIPGKHYNFVKGEITEVSETEAIYNFFRQMLIGDRSDNIPGIDGIGEKKSEKLLSGKSPKEQLEIVQGLYKKQYGEEQWSEIFDEIATLLWIQRKDEPTYKDCKLIYR